MLEPSYNRKDVAQWGCPGCGTFTHTVAPNPVLIISGVECLICGSKYQLSDGEAPFLPHPRHGIPVTLRIRGGTA